MTVVGSEEIEVEDANDQEVDFTSVVRPASPFAKQLQCSNTDDMEMTSSNNSTLPNNAENRSAEYHKLIENGLHEKVASRLEEIYKTGM